MVTASYGSIYSEISEPDTGKRTHPSPGTEPAI